jgi:Winged helix-turn helix
MLNIHDLKAAHEKAIGHETSNSTVYNVPARHGWRKRMPRPVHPKRDIAARNAFKKNDFPHAVRKATRAAARRSRRLRRGPDRHRTEVASGLIREYIYLHGAVSPKDGTRVYPITPTSNTVCFQAFLNVLSRKFARRDILLVRDGAPNHRSSELVLPGNISALFPPLH